MAGSRFVDAPPEIQRVQISLYEEYRINGLVATKRPRIGNVNAEGSAFVVMHTLGVSGLVAPPVTLVDLTARNTQRYRLRLWYDQSERLIGVKRRNVSKPRPSSR